MSSEQIRYDAQYGLHEHMRDILKNRANTAEADEVTLTPLMYAVWNGHVECVKYLVCNDVGIDVTGNKVSSLYMTSCKGYTALHLAGLDCPMDRCKEITTILLVAGLEPVTAKCVMGQSAEDLAIQEHNEPFLEALTEFRSRETNEKIDITLNELKQNLFENYTYIHNPTMMVEKWKANFKVPAYVYADHHVGELPEGMHIHEHLIMPLIQDGYSLKTGVDALNCIDFARQQANINEKRREKLLEADKKSTWEAVDMEAVKAARVKKSRRGARRKADDESKDKEDSD